MTTTTRAQALAGQAREAAQVRNYQTDPDVVALTVERIRTVTDRLIWSAIFIGLAFTMINVQQFAADGAEAWTLKWLAAWLLDPMVSLVVIGILLAESVTSRWQVHTGGWVRTAKWFALGSTYAMNTWEAWSEVLTSRGGQGWDHVVQHSVPVALVLVAAEAAPVLRDKLTEAVLVAARHAAQRPPVSAPLTTGGAQPTVPAVSGAPLTTATPLTANPAAGATVSVPAGTERPALTATLTGAAASADGTAGEPAVSAATHTMPAVVENEGQRRFDHGQVDAETAGDASGRTQLHLVSAPASRTAPAPRSKAASQQPSAGETTDTTTPEADPEARMRTHWDREVAQGRVPSGAQLAREGGVSPATGKRRRAAWEADLPEHMRGGASDAASA